MDDDHDDHDDRRRHLRYAVNERCAMAVTGGTYTGLVVDISRSGAGIFLDQMEVQPAPGTVTEVDIENIARLPSRVVRLMFGGVGVTFVFDRDADGTLAAALDRAIERYAEHSAGRYA